MPESYVRCPSGHVTAYHAEKPNACPTCSATDLKILTQRKVRD